MLLNLITPSKDTITLYKLTAKPQPQGAVYVLYVKSFNINYILNLATFL